MTGLPDIGIEPYYQDKWRAIYKGDCLEILPLLPEKSVDMILCDLPYGITACKWDSVVPLESLWAEYRKLAKDKGAIVLTAKQPFTSILALSGKELFRYELIWQKDKGSNPLLANKAPMQCHENILVYYNNLPVYNPQYWYSTPYVKKQGKCTFGETKGDAPKPTDKTVEDGRRFPLSVIKIAREMNRDKKSNHPTQKPVALFEYLIKTYTSEFDLVVDNCLGSGTTAIASGNANRYCIGIELEEKYCEIAANRCSADAIERIKKGEY